MNITKIKLPKLNERTKERLQDAAIVTAKTVLGLFALGLCLKGCAHYARRWEQAREEQEALDKTTTATLIDKAITPARYSDNRDVALYFDMDGDPRTAEAMLDIRAVKAEKALLFYNLTNGTKKSVAEWKKMTPIGNSAYSK